MFFDRVKNKFKSVIKTPQIEFLCFKEDYGVIAEPYPARKLMPEWFKVLPPKLNRENTFKNSTIKRCPPFLDAMTIGWIIPLAADVEINTNEDASLVNYKWQFYRSMIENHSFSQISSEKSPNPNLPKPPMKFMNYWLCKVPPGWSVLFVPPLNRPDPRFTCISGLVDCDGYFEFVNFPFFFNIPNYVGMIERGTPLVQAIPIKRDAIMTEFDVRSTSDTEIEELKLQGRKYSAHESYYRDYVWSRK